MRGEIKLLPTGHRRTGTSAAKLVCITSLEDESYPGLKNRVYMLQENTEAVG